MTRKRSRRRWLPAFASLAVHAVALLLFDAFYGIPHPGTRPIDKQPGMRVTPSQRVTFLRVHPGGWPGLERAQEVSGNQTARSLPNVLARPLRASEGDESSSDSDRAVGASLAIMPPPRSLSAGPPARARQIILDSALKDWTAEAERTREVENPGQFGGWVATIDGQRYGLEPGWLRAGKISVPMPPVVFIPEPYGYERQREASWQRTDMRRQIRQRLIDSSVTAAAIVLRSTRERQRQRAPR